MTVALLIAALVPVIIALVAVLSQAGFNTGRFGGLASLALGVLGAVFASSQGALIPPVDAFNVVLAGAIAGLTASGTYSGGRALAGK